LPLELQRRPRTPVASSLHLLDSLVSPYVGVVRSVEEVLAEPADLALPNLCCETGWLGSPQYGAGSGRDRTTARAAAIGEAIERYSACLSDDVPSVVSSAGALRDAVPAERFALHTPTQHAEPGFPYASFDDETPVAWIDAWSLPDGRPVKLPGQLVYLHWRHRPGERRIAVATSSGLACHATVEEALLRGLFEVLERDTFMLTWRARLSWPQLSWGPESRLGWFERRFLRPTGLKTAALDLSRVWNVPSVLAVVRASVPGDAPLGVGAAAAASVEEAAEKALDEAVRVRSWASVLRGLDPRGDRLPSPAEIRTFEEHIQHYAYERHAAGVAFLDASPERRQTGDVAALEGVTPVEQLFALCERLRARGYGAYGVDVTSPDVRSTGLCVLKVVVPELCALDVEHRARYLGSPRLREEPVRLGFRKDPLSEEELNPDPHPFP
jgi:ribosomal protein S12 methylthiotransferase accessory factor